MYPVLFSAGGWQLWTYGVLVALAFFLGLAMAMREARLSVEDPRRVLDLAFYVVVAAVVGGKIGFALATPGDAAQRARALWQGGLSFPGGLVAAGAVAAWYLRRHRLSPARLADLAAPAVLLGVAIADLGCLAAGCEYGKPTALPVGIVFRDARGLAPTGIPLHPTQLYSAGLALLLLVVVLWLRGQPGERRPGQLALLAVGGLALGQFAVEFFRGDPRPMLVSPYLSVAHSIALAVAVVALAVLWRRRRRPARAAATVRDTRPARGRSRARGATHR